MPMAVEQPGPKQSWMQSYYAADRFKTSSMQCLGMMDQGNELYRNTQDEFAKQESLVM